MAADAARGPALGRELRVRGDLGRAGLRARQGARRPGDGDHDAGPLAVGQRQVDRAERDHLGTRREVDPGHAAGGPALRPDLVGAEAQQLRVARDEDQVALARAAARRAPTTLSPSSQGDDLPVVLVRRGSPSSPA